ncbi:uncharacterized protein TrAtP1_005408 [Trichoderma atroviride]|uniref:uncharacterized protein n=1 Tax=Hypocrea atroviridis TaxID=63577 RepID=UPI00332AF328|nr:hypothetical protein TrAtP1_005408 [Trichoderma atroviride]
MHRALASYDYHVMERDAAPGSRYLENCAFFSLALRIYMVATNINSSTGARWIDQQPPTAVGPWHRRPLQHALFLWWRALCNARGLRPQIGSPDDVALIRRWRRRRRGKHSHRRNGLDSQNAAALEPAQSAGCGGTGEDHFM